MPYAPLKPCTHPGCPELCPTGNRCDKHKREETRRVDDRRGSSTSRGYGARWRRIRNAFLSQHPLCVMCEDEGRIVPATDVDHVVPHKGDMNLFCDIRNLQALCHECHSRKTATQDGRWG